MYKRILFYTISEQTTQGYKYCQNPH